MLNTSGKHPYMKTGFGTNDVNGKCKSADNILLTCLNCSRVISSMCPSLTICAMSDESILGKKNHPNFVIYSELHLFAW